MTDGAWDAWHRAIAARTDAMRVDTALCNDYDTEIPWPDDEPAVPHAVYLADDRFYSTLALDFDGQGAQSDADQAVDLIGACGFSPVLVDSGTGRHVLVALNPPVDADLIRQIVDELCQEWTTLDKTPMVNASTGCLRPPGSPHRSGGRSRVLQGDLDAFLLDSAPGAFDSLATVLGLRSRLDHDEVRFLRLLVRGDPMNEYQSRSELQQALAYFAVLAGWSEQRYISELLDEANKGGVRAQSLPRRRAVADLERSYRKAIRRIHRPVDLASLDRQLYGFLTHAQTQDWAGVAGATDLAVVEVFVAVAQKLGKTEFRVSNRDIAEEAKINKETANRAVHRLIDRGLIRRTAAHQKRKSATYQLVLPPLPWGNETLGPNPYSHKTQGGCEMTVRVESPHDVFRWGVLGHTARLIYEALEINEERSTAAITDSVGCHSKTTSRRLKEMEGLGLAEQNGEGRWKRGQRDLDEVAEELGADRRSWEQKREHELERAGFEEYLYANLSPRGDMRIGKAWRRPTTEWGRETA